MQAHDRGAPHTRQLHHRHLMEAKQLSNLFMLQAEELVTSTARITCHLLTLEEG